MVVALLGPFLGSVATNCLAACRTHRWTDPTVFALAGTRTTVTGVLIAVIAGFNTYQQAVPTASSTASGSNDGADPASLELAGIRTAVTRSGIAVITGLGTSELLVTAHGDVHTD
jgi:hypothetical protein